MKKGIFLLFSVFAAISSHAQDTTKFIIGEPPGNKNMKHEETEFYAPVPPVVTPGKSAGEAPSDAIFLFDGKNLDAWCGQDDPTKPALWTVSDGVMTVKKGTGSIRTKQSFLDYQMHIEFRIPEGIHGEGQARGNSGIFLANTGKGDDGYELQVLDNYNNSTYVNGQVGSIYKQSVPLANPSRKPGEWQVYDIAWSAPRFNADGSLRLPGRVTVFLNGVLVQNNFTVKGLTHWTGQPYYVAHGACPIKLQDHGDPSEPISFRNIWIRPL